MRTSVRFRPASKAWRPLFGLLAVGACAEKNPPPTPPIPVTVATAERRAVPLELAATGTVEPVQTVAVQAQVSGILRRVAFKEGEEVKQGQVLFELDPRPYRAALDQAAAILARDRAQATNAAQEAKRYETLVEKEYVTSQQYDQARTSAAATEATLAGSQAAVDQARLNLQYATIRAPITGRTGSLLVREGNLVRGTTSEPLVRINQLRPILVRFAVPADNLPLIQTHLGKSLVVRAEPSGGGDPSEGTLSFVDNAVDSSTGTILLKGRFPNDDGSLWPGGFVNVRLQLYVEPDALVIPAAAVVSGQQGSFVFVIQPDSSASTKAVTVSRTAGDFAIVTGDVQPGDRVVVDGQLRLRQGSKVQIKAAADTARRLGVV
ncbi:MAG: efflux RND transporter periplasmic adaptor subunit [Gemmatimonadota bacterium]|nr:efflux RND transporter periplasmic adaptor subunit [Gemmatimonadota bacterium]